MDGGSTAAGPGRTIGTTPAVAGLKPIVIAGLPRSGTTWTLQALGTSPGVRRTFEPDNEEWHPAAIHGKHRLGRYPALVPGQRDRAYHHLWEWILSGAHEGLSGEGRLVPARPGPAGTDLRRKSGPAHAAGRHGGPRPQAVTPADRPDLGPSGSSPSRSTSSWPSSGWASEFDVDVLVLLRHPANVLASWLGMNLKDSRSAALETSPEVRARFVEPWGVPLPGGSRLEQMCWRIGLLTAALEQAASRHPSWHLRVHEDLCTDPPGRFRSLFDDLGLEWTGATEDYLAHHDQPGQGFNVNRLASELPDAWQRRLDEDQVTTLRRVLEPFPIARWRDADFTRSAAE